MAKAATWACPDAEVRKRGEQTGLDTRVVHAVNDASSLFAFAVKRGGGLSSRGKLAAWGLRAQA